MVQSRSVIAGMKANPVDDFYAIGARMREDGRKLHPIFQAQVKTPQGSEYPREYCKIILEIERTDSVPPKVRRQLSIRREMAPTHAGPR